MEGHYYAIIVVAVVVKFILICLCCFRYAARRPATVIRVCQPRDDLSIVNRAAPMGTSAPPHAHPVRNNSCPPPYEPRQPYPSGSYYPPDYQMRTPPANVNTHTDKY